MTLADPLSDGTDPRASVEAYREDGGVVLHDAERPLAWVRSNHAVSIHEQR